jgi:cation diffusion facilitator CzcD-associated flavoprotein CzcO
MEKILIIGAGPAGLGIAGRLRNENIPFDIFEAQDRVAYSWSQHYDRLHLHTVNEKSALPHLPFPEDFPTFVSRQDLLDYCENYTKHFNIQPVFNQHIQNIKKTDNGLWQVSTADNKFVYQNVIVATGINRVPFEPRWDGIEGFIGNIIHSRSYKNTDAYKDKKVLVVGMGNTGAEIALDLANDDIEVYLSVRGPVNIVPLELFGKPTQETAFKLSKLPNWLSDRISNVAQRFSIGKLDKFGLKTPKISPSAQLRETGKTPVIDLGTAKQIRAGKIKVVPDIDHFDLQSIIFKDGRELEFHEVILCTGYRSLVDEFIPSIDPFLDIYDNPSTPVGTGELKGLYFLGFDNFKPGGILGAINYDSKVILEDLKRNG